MKGKISIGFRPASKTSSDTLDLSLRIENKKVSLSSYRN